jgi:hypothetical protein
LSEENERKPSRWQRFTGVFRRGESPRTKGAFSRLKVEGGFTNLFNVDDVEQRRNEIMFVLKEIETDEENLYKDNQGNFKSPLPEEVKAFKQRVNHRVHLLFMGVGSPWYRGLDDRELAKRVRAYLEVWNYAGDLEAFVDDFYMWGMQLLNLSWKALDVTNTPPYIIESSTKYVVNPEDNRIKSLKDQDIEEY